MLGVLWPVASVVKQDDHGGRIYLDAVHSGSCASFVKSVAAVLLVIADDVDRCHPRFLCGNCRHSADTVFESVSELD